MFIYIIKINNYTSVIYKIYYYICVMKTKLITLDPELFKKIEESAKKNVRSVNAEISFVLGKNYKTK